MDRWKIWIREELIILILLVPGTILASVLEFSRRDAWLVIPIGFGEVAAASIIQYILEEKVKPRVVKDENETDKDGFFFSIMVFELLFVMFYGGNAIIWDRGVLPVLFENAAINNLVLGVIFAMAHMLYVMLTTGRGEVFQLRDDDKDELW